MQLHKSTQFASTQYQEIVRNAADFKSRRLVVLLLILKITQLSRPMQTVAVILQTPPFLQCAVLSLLQSEEISVNK